MQKIDHKLFINMLQSKGITQKEFSKYAKIPYDTVTGWKKRGKVPAYAMVIARDMAYRMKLNQQVRDQFQKRYKKDFIEVIGLEPKEQKRIEVAFWGSNYTANEIIEKVQSGDEYFIKRLKENVPEKLYRKIMQIQVECK